MKKLILQFLSISFLILIIVSCEKDPPIANFTASPTNIKPGESVQFTDQSLNFPTSWSWYFGESADVGQENYSSLQNPVHTYSKPGTYTVGLTATNNAGFDSWAKTNYIIVSDIIFNPDLTYETLIDDNGNPYKTIEIGNQTWMAENLKATIYNDRTAIPLVTDNSAWANLTSPAYCWYENDRGTYKASYGALYNWYAVNPATNGDKNICPSGWHVPTADEWITLSNYMGGWEVAGGKLKEIETIHWHNPNTGASNQSGFTALPGGYRYDNQNPGSFNEIGSVGGWWSATDFVNDQAAAFSLRNSSVKLEDDDATYRAGLSVRCIKD